MSAAESTALTRAEQPEAPTDQQIEQIRQRGRSLVAHKEEIGKLYKMIAGLEWGSGSSMVVRGSEMSEATRYAFAEFCKITKANPLLHVDVLGGKPYLNANYWSDRINSDPFFHHYEQRDLSPSVEQALRNRALRHREIAAELGDSDKAEAARRKGLALDFEDEADQMALDRAKWGAPEWATSVVETRVVRFLQVAPLDAIRAGEIRELSPFLVEVPECNWAGGRPRVTKTNRKTGQTYDYDPDPIGNVEPEKTARTRSLRRAATRSFPAWMQAYDEQIRKAEEALEGEWEVLRSDSIEVRASLPVSDGPQAARIGAGEPHAANANGAKSLPVEDENGPVAEPADPAPVEEPRAFDPGRARREFFGELHAVGITEEKRYTWASDNELPESTKEWTPADHAKALDVLRAPDRQKLSEGARLLGLNPEQLARERFTKGMLALTVKELRQLNDEIAARADGGA